MTVTFVPLRRRDRVVLFLLFFGSGFSSLIYQVVWLRMAFAHFGIVTPVLSVVISAFMLGLGLGSWAAGRLGLPLAMRLGVSPSVLYGVAELAIGAGAFAVPWLFDIGEAALMQSGVASSTRFLLLSGLVITASILPWCVMMGATYPLMMAYVRARDGAGHGAAFRSFSYLYLANVLGAMMGTLASALVLIEVMGFARTSLVAACVNGLIAMAAFALRKVDPRAVGTATGADTVITAPTRADMWLLVVLFTTGFCSLAMEVVWTRAFTVTLTTTIYAFAAILATYLLATWVGATAYRRALRTGAPLSDFRLLAMAGASALLPVVMNDPRMHALFSMILFLVPLPWDVVAVLLSIAPFCAVLGYLTSFLMDEYSRGDPRRAGRGYGFNILGGILGPLVAGYLIVPSMDVRYGLIVLTLPIVALLFVALVRTGETWRLAFPALLMLGLSAGISNSYEGYILASEGGRLRRDHVGTVIAHGSGMERQLLVNGVGMTVMTPITKVMAHLPLAVHGKARRGLVICFGMGTSFRSMMSWAIETTVVDLVPSVPLAFSYFHADAALIIANPLARVVVDDGRRFLARAEGQFDIIVLDPPPPVEAAGSSLLYSTSFYAAAKRRLAPDGILQQWLPGAEPAVVAAVAQSLRQSFPHVLVFESIEHWGHHFLASMAPISLPSAAALLARIPEASQRDLVEWGPEATPAAMVQAVLAGQVSLESIIKAQPAVRAVTDDRPFNEYFLLRRYLPASQP